jgi:hypothetical protein
MICRDSDCDSICDIEEGDEFRRDSDGDGNPDFRDLDADDDGISDREEAGDDDPSTPAIDRDQNGIADYLDPDYPLHAHQRAGSTSQPSAASDAGAEPAACTARPAAIGCGDDESGMKACDGLDNDCDGRIDEEAACACTRGDVRSCFTGPTARLQIGMCQLGVQRCIGAEPPSWGPCEDEVTPSAERCNGVDDDCNGCADDAIACSGGLSCPGPGDLRTPDATPFVPYTLDATQFYAGDDALAYHWSIVSSGCDRMWSALDPGATVDSGRQSVTLFEPNAARTQVLFTLSGSYRVSLVIETAGGEQRCDFLLHVRGDGLRVELCWDKTGPLAARHGDAVDLDLLLAKSDAAEVCDRDRCSGSSSLWGYQPTRDLSRCTGPGAQRYAAYQVLGFCPNPRLDSDNSLDARARSLYVPENIDLDAPRTGDRFRIAVRYRADARSTADDADAGSAGAIATRPLINVYCRGELRAAFGGDPEQTNDREDLRLSEPEQVWRVADVVISPNGCDVAPLHDPNAPNRDWLVDHDSGYGAP